MYSCGQFCLRKYLCIFNVLKYLNMIFSVAMICGSVARMFPSVIIHVIFLFSFLMGTAVRCCIRQNRNATPAQRAAGRAQTSCALLGHACVVSLTQRSTTHNAGWLNQKTCAHLLAHVMHIRMAHMHNICNARSPVDSKNRLLWIVGCTVGCNLPLVIACAHTTPAAHNGILCIV